MGGISIFFNVGGKLQKIAKILAWIGIVFGGLMLLLGVLGLFTSENSSQNSAIVLIIYGVLMPVLSWISCLALYGFGQLIQDTQQIRWKMEKHWEEKEN